MASRSALLRRSSLALLLLAASAVGGCVPDDWRVSAWNEAGVLQHGWVPTRDLPSKPVYCYRTLANVDCYDRPLPGQSDRRQGAPLPEDAGKKGAS